MGLFDIEDSINKLDNLQRRHGFLAFGYAVVKRYGESQVGYQTALLTYYAFLALFPLLLVLTTLTQIIATSHPELQTHILSGVTSYFPVLGGQLSAHVHSLHKNGLALVIGLLFSFYGARGVADVFRNGVYHIWEIPKAQQAGFPRSTIKSIGIVTIGGLGFIVASVLTSLAAAGGHEPILRVLSLVVDAAVLFVVFSLLLKLSLPGNSGAKERRTASVVAAIGLVLLQSLGGYVLTRELKSLDALYSYFALALGLIFWIYLQAQLLYYACEVATVKHRKLWPRSLSGKELTAADKRVARLHASVADVF